MVKKKNQQRGLVMKVAEMHHSQPGDLGKIFFLLLGLKTDTGTHEIYANTMCDPGYNTGTGTK